MNKHGRPSEAWSARVISTVVEVIAVALAHTPGERLVQKHQRKTTLAVGMFYFWTAVICATGARPRAELGKVAYGILLCMEILFVTIGLGLLGALAHDFWTTRKQKAKRRTL